MQASQIIDVDNSINSGQVFLWRKHNSDWYGINGQDILRIEKDGKIQSYQDLEVDFFRKLDNMNKIIKSISKDKIIRNSIKKYSGLRILQQDPFQCLISFIISSNSNIQKIKTNLETISKKFGERVRFQNQEFFLFPKPEKLAKASINEIRNCGVGYRASFVKEAAKMVFSNKINLENLKKSNYQETKNEICLIPGVGNKVADCIMLFSLNKLEAFPLDRWIIRILEKYYP
ncbi:MAG: DNA-3-methyladenine glycosylase 2, partial [Nitrosopumilus sp.]